MAWDDFGFMDANSGGDFGGGGDWGSGDIYSGGSWSPQDYAFSMPQTPEQQSFAGDIQSGQGMQYDPMSNGWSNAQGGQVSMSQPAGGGGNWFTNMFQGGGGGAPGAGGGAGGQGGGQQGGWMGALPNILGAGAGLAGVLGQLIGGGEGGSQQRTLNNAGQGALNSANSQMGVAAQGNLPAQQMQMSLLQALQSGQGLPPAYQQLIEQSFQPQMGDLYTQAAEMGRKRGFHDAPATSPAGGAILGPGLSNLQGQMASEKLKMMMAMPGVFQNPINSQLTALNQSNTGLMNTAQMNAGSQTSQPMTPLIGLGVGAGMQGLGQAMQMGSTAKITYAGV